MEAMLSDESGGSEDDGEVAADMGHDNNILDNLRADDHILSRTSIHHEPIHRQLPDPCRLTHRLLRGRYSHHVGRLRSPRHASLEGMERKTRYIYIYIYRYQPLHSLCFIISVVFRELFFSWCRFLQLTKNRHWFSTLNDRNGSRCIS